MILGGGSDVAIAGDLKVSSPEYKNGVNTKYNGVINHDSCY